MKIIFAISLFLLAFLLQVFAEDSKWKSKLSQQWLTVGIFVAHPCLQPLIEEDEPGCNAKIPSWYHDHYNGGNCKPFMYNGCKKNENHFDTKEECDRMCTEWHTSHCKGIPPVCNWSSFDCNFGIVLFTEYHEIHAVYWTIS